MPHPLTARRTARSQSLAAPYPALDAPAEPPAAAPARPLHSFAQVRVTADSPPVQAKLTVNTPGDLYEQEADATADQVLRMSLPAPSTKLQREEGDEEGQREDGDEESQRRDGDEEVQCKEAGQDAGGEDLATADVSSIVSAGLAGGGRPLDPDTRAFMEPRFGHDFSKVRIHDSAQASSSAQAVAARAYTLGSNIAFRSGEYAPGSGEGRRLLAHELTHVVQQAGIAQRKLPIELKDAEAARIHSMFGPSPPVSVQRQLDQNFPCKGKPSLEQKTTCEEFAIKVSGLVDKAYEELTTGIIDEWKGPRWTAFLGLLSRGSIMAITHAGNVIEERVYQLMNGTGMGAKWTAQTSEHMGGASRPDIVINFDDGKEGLVDITSERGHIYGKAGGWFTSEQFVYIAEAYFPSITASDIPIIREAIDKGGMTPRRFRKLKQEADAAVAEKLDEKAKAQSSMRDAFWACGSMKVFADRYFEGRVTEASRQLRRHNIRVKGMTRQTGRKTRTEEAKAKGRKAMQKAKREKASNKPKDSDIEMVQL